MFRENVDCDKITKDITKYIKNNCSRYFIKKANHRNEIFYNVQKYYFLSIDILAKAIVNKNCLYNYEYDIIMKKVMNNVINF